MHMCIGGPATPNEKECVSVYEWMTERYKFDASAGWCTRIVSWRMTRSHNNSNNNHSSNASKSWTLLHEIRLHHTPKIDILVFSAISFRSYGAFRTKTQKSHGKNSTKKRAHWNNESRYGLSDYYFYYFTAYGHSTTKRNRIKCTKSKIKQQHCKTTDILGIFFGSTCAFSLIPLWNAYKHTSKHLCEDSHKAIDRNE